MERFAGMLTQSDLCAVVCILSHGGDGFIYGSDGKTVSINDLLQCLNNTNCAPMAGKPKVVVLQSCQGCKYCSITTSLQYNSCYFLNTCTDCHTVSLVARPDAGVMVSNAAIAADGRMEHLPEISDFITCYPSMPGK